MPRHYIVFFFCTLCALAGCSDGGEPVTVDFSRTVDIHETQPHEDDAPKLRVAVAAMISPKATFSYYQRILEFIGASLGREVQMIQRKTYAEINELLARGEIDLAFICSGPFATGSNRYGFHALATPVVRGEPYYRSYLLVGADSPFQRLQDLQGETFAFTDPDSNTGTLVPTFWLQQSGHHPETFFTRTIYTYSHDNSILAVARGLVDGAAVDGHIWEYYAVVDPQHTSQTRVIRKSRPFGNPPVVASSRLSPSLRKTVIDLLLSMHERPEGREILEELMIDRFVEPRDEWYEPIKEMARSLAGHESATP